VTDDVNLRHDPTSTSASLSLIPSGSQITIDCVATGEQIDGPRGLTDKWDKTVWKGFGGYVTDQYVDTKNDVNDRSIIPAC
jgi:uncharacterized protein YraI